MGNILQCTICGLVALAGAHLSANAMSILGAREAWGVLYKCLKTADDNCLMCAPAVNDRKISTVKLRI